MGLTRIQHQEIIAQFGNLGVNQPVKLQVQNMESSMNYVMSLFEGNIKPGYSQGLKLYLQETREIEMEADKLDISVSNTKDSIYHFLSLATKYYWGILAFVV